MQSQQVVQLFQKSVEKRMPGEVQNLDWRSFLDAIADVFRDGKLDQQDFDTAILVCEDLFERYVRGYDLPGVPNVVEPFVDDTLKSLIRPVLTAMFERLLPS